MDIMNRILSYMFYSICNILFFSYLSITVYQLYCLNIDSNISTIIEFYITNTVSKYNIFFSLNEKLHYSLILFSKLQIIELVFDFYVVELNLLDHSYLYDDLVFYNYYSIFQLYIFTKTSSYYEFVSDSIKFFCLHDFIWIIPNETILLFFRLYNNTYFDIECLSFYVMYPIVYNFFIEKLQCFCFSSIMVLKHELLEMPVILYSDSFITELFIRELYIFYLMLVYS